MSQNNPEYDWSLEKWCSGFYGIYHSNDNKRTLSNFWLQVSNDASKVAEAVRRQKHELSMYNLGNAFCWMCCFVERLKEDINKFPNGKIILQTRGKSFQNWILFRYPLCCHHCGFNLCHCSLYSEMMEHRKDDQAKEFKKFKDGIEKRVKKERKKLFNPYPKKKYPLNKLFEEFNNIYGNKVFSANLEDLTFHYLEEVGEVGHAITLLETLIGHNTADELEKKIKDDPNIDLNKIYSGEDWREGFKQAKKSKEKKICNALKTLEKEQKLKQNAVKSICYMIMDEIADVFSWTTAIVNKIATPEKKYSIIEVFSGADWIPKEKRGKAYLFGTGSVKEFRCPYCISPECQTWCPLSNLLTSVSKSRIEGN